MAHIPRKQLSLIRFGNEHTKEMPLIQYIFKRVSSTVKIEMVVILDNRWLAMSCFTLEDIYLQMFIELTFGCFGLGWWFNSGDFLCYAKIPLVQIEEYFYCYRCWEEEDLLNNDFTKVKNSFQSSTMKFNETLEIFVEESPLNNHLERIFRSFQPGGIISSGRSPLHGHWPEYTHITWFRFI